MPTSPRQNIMCRYAYDATDRSIERTPVNQPGVQRFYCNNRLSSEIQGTSKRSIFQHDNQLLAQQHHRDGKIDTALWSTDRQRSVLNVLDASQPNPLAYTAYGHGPAEDGAQRLLGFNGEAPDPVTGHYPLGNGYRQFNPVLMRFNSPDSWSPFGKGGLNAYGYCGGDPINRSDPSGHMILSLIGFGTAAAGLVTTVVGLITEDEVVKKVGVTIALIGAVVGTAASLAPKLQQIHPSLNFGRSRPPTNQIRRPSDDQVSLNGQTQNINPGVRSPESPDLQTNNPNAPLNHSNTLQGTDDSTQIAQYIGAARAFTSVKVKMTNIRTLKTN